jgi:hypothetical protein
MAVSLLAAASASAAHVADSGHWWGDWATLVAALVTSAIAVVLLACGIGRWANNRFQPWDVTFTDKSLHPDVNEPTGFALVGVPSFVYVRIRARTFLEFRDLQVRIQETSFQRKWGGWKFWRRGALRLWREFDQTSRDVVALGAVTDAEAEWAQGRVHGNPKWEPKFTTVAMPPWDDRNGTIIRFSPSFPRLAEEAIQLKIGLCGTRKWEGLLGLYLPTATHRRHWVHRSLIIGAKSSGASRD